MSFKVGDFVVLRGCSICGFVTNAWTVGEDGSDGVAVDLLGGPWRNIEKFPTDEVSHAILSFVGPVPVERTR